MFVILYVTQHKRLARLEILVLELGVGLDAWTLGVARYPYRHSAIAWILET
jgi:hypothetical protein